MYGAKIVGGMSETKTFYPHEAIAVGDLVVQRTDGQVEIVAGGAGTDANGDVIAGVAMQAASGASTTVKIAVACPVEGGRMTVLMDNDNVGTTFAASHEGGNFDVTGGTGAMVVDTSTITQGGTKATNIQQLKCIEYNPQGFGFDTDTSIGLYEIVTVQ